MKRPLWTPTRFRLSEIDRQLKTRPELRETVDRMAVDYSTTGEEFVAALAAIGIKASKSGAARYRLRVRPSRGHGGFSERHARVLAYVVRMSPRDVSALAKHLGIDH